MQFRILGRTGLNVSEIGLGGNEYRRKHLVVDGRFTSFDPDRPRLVAEAVERGVNYFDTTFIEECHSLGHSIRTAGLDRSKMIISGMSIDTLYHVGEREEHDRKRYLEEELITRLELLGTDYFDIFQICNLESGYDLDVLEGVLEIMVKWRERGIVRSLGASAHDSDLLTDVIERSDPFDVVMARCNYNIGRHDRLFEAVSSRDVGLVVIKPLVWFDYGVSFVPLCKSLIDTWPEQETTAAQNALAWILAQPEVSTIIPSANSLEEMRENVGATAISADLVDFELLDRCANLPNRADEMVELLDHPFEEVRLYAKSAVVSTVGADFGFDKSRYRARIRETSATE